MAEKILTIKCSNATTSEVSVESFTITVLDLKNKIAEKLQIPSEQQRLIFKGKVLKDENSLEYYEVEDGNTIHLVKGSAKPNNNASTSPATPIATPISSNIPSSSSALNNNAFGASPMAGGFNPYGGFGGGGFGGSPMDMNSMQDQMMRNPEMMQQIMSSPMMENLMNNPELLRNMMTSNPQIQSLLETNPQLRHVLNDPAVCYVAYVLRPNFNPNFQIGL